MAVTEKRTASQIWGVGVRQVVYMALGAALYAALSIPTNLIPIPALVTSPYVQLSSFLYSSGLSLVQLSDFSQAL